MSGPASPARACAIWIDPTFGASGDMLLGALGALLSRRDPDAPDPLDGLAALGLDGWRLERETVQRCGLSAARCRVVLDDTPHHHRAWSSIDAQLAAADLPDRASTGARATFRRLAEVEAAQHGVAVDDVHFHEVGAVDALVDIVGVWLLVDALDPAEIVVGPVGLGRGTVSAAHGLLPLPAPATAALLEGHPVHPLDVGLETCTPTGAALLVTLADRTGALPAGALGATVRGAGGRDPKSHPNVVTVIEIEGVSYTDDAVLTDRTEITTRTVLSTNVDDVTGEVLAATIEALLGAGADDAWVVPIVMKKGRPAHEVKVLCEPADADRLADVLLAQTGSLGVRIERVTRRALPRTFTTVTVRGHEVRLKVGPHGAKPEFDDLAAVAVATGVPVRVLAAEAVNRHRL